jgi:hypothetical protein
MRNRKLVGLLVVLVAAGSLAALADLYINFADPDVHRSMLRLLAVMGGLSVFMMGTTLLSRLEEPAQVVVKKPSRRP